jgi:nicotinate phosphoribosyltransferase
MMNQIITSILDNDLYKFTMLNAILKKYPNQQVEYKFYSREKREYPLGFCAEFKRQIEYMDTLQLSQVEELYLRSKCGHLFDEEFFSFLQDFRFDSSKIRVRFSSTDELTVSIKGTWEEKILYEVPLMAIISEVFFHLTSGEVGLSKFKTDTALKGETLKSNNIFFMEFGTRRRYSKLTQSLAISILKMTAGSHFSGTSNVYFSMIHNVPVFGTVAHEWIMFHGATVGYAEANNAAITAWRDVYGTELDVILPDTYTTKSFFETLDPLLKSSSTKFRQDSGDPIVFTDLFIENFKGSAMDRTILYSDGLNVEKILLIDKHRVGEVIKKYAIGTNFTNDLEGIIPLNMVIKLDKVNGKSAVKLSDAEGKITGDPEEAKTCKKELGI